MPERMFLDTNAVVAFLNGVTSVTTRLAEVEVCIASIVLGELYYGARKSARVAENLRRLELWAEQVLVFSCTTETAKQYGIIKQQLRSKGRPIPDNDMWIAAVAMEHGLALLTQDKHLGDVDGLSLETW